MEIVELGNPKYVWLRCPLCDGLFYVVKEFWSGPFNHISLHCPFCQQDFKKEQSKEMWGNQ